MNTLTILYYYDADWAGLYVNENFVLSNCSIRLCDIKNHTPIEKIVEIDLDSYQNCVKYLDDYDDFPKDMSLSNFLKIDSEGTE
jgi:hypothetical protein